MPVKDQPPKNSSLGIKCPRCASSKTRKNGIVRGTQRFLCQRCKTNFHLSNNKKHPRFLKPLLEFISRAEVTYSKKITGTGDIMSPRRVAEALENMLWEDRDLLRQIAAEPQEQDGRKHIAKVFYSE